MILISDRQLILCFQLIAGIGASTLLLIVACVLIQRFPGVKNVGFDATGILPSMWIAYQHPELQELFSQVVKPTTDNLRTMGMIKMQLGPDWLSSAVPSSKFNQSADDV
jgi:hypothetical protein